MRSPSLVFTRCIHALHDLFTSTPTGRLPTLASKGLPQLENDVRIQERNGKTIATVSSIADLVSHLEPFSYLEKLPSEKPLYRIIELLKFPPRKKPAEFKRAGSGKELHITTTCPPGALKHRVSKAYEFLSKGWRVEFHVRPLKGNKGRTVDWALQNALHLRPEVISAAMPEGTQVLMPPVQDGTTMLWVLDHKENRLKAGLSHKAPTRSQMPMGLTARVKLKGAPKRQKDNAEPSHEIPEDRRGLIGKSSDGHILEAHRNAQARDDIDSGTPKPPGFKSSRESAPGMVYYSPAQANSGTKKSSLPDPKSNTAPDLEDGSTSEVEHPTQHVSVEEPLENLIRRTWKRNEAGEPQKPFSKREFKPEWKDKFQWRRDQHKQSD